MDPRFPPLLSQHVITPRRSSRSLALPVLPTLPYTEWLVAAAFLLLMMG